MTPDTTGVSPTPTTERADQEQSLSDALTRKPSAPVWSTFWSRHKTVINFWLDAVLLVLFVVLAGMLAVLALVFPPGVLQATIWGSTAADWLNGMFLVFCTFSLGIVLHVMLHWGWICGTVATKLFGRKAGKDDGSQTLIGVGFLILVLHLLGAFVLVARVALVNPS